MAAIGIILGAVYMLHMAARVIMGPLRVPAVDHGHDETAHAHSGAGHSDHGHEKNDIGFREIAILVPLAIAVVIIGVRPGLLMDGMRGEIEKLRNAPAAVTTAPGEPYTPPFGGEVARVDREVVR